MKRDYNELGNKIPRANRYPSVVCLRGFKGRGRL